VTDAAGNQYVVFLGCAAAAHSPGSAPGWTRDTYGAAAIQAQIIAQTPVTATGLTISSLAIVFDEGTDQGQGYVFLDNITVNNQVWTSPATTATSNSPTALGALVTLAGAPSLSAGGQRTSASRYGEAAVECRLVLTIRVILPR
jgi:hypothetical protein